MVGEEHVTLDLPQALLSIGFLVARHPLYPLRCRSMKDDQTPATKADVRALAESTKADHRELTESMNLRFERLNDSLDRVLDVLVNVDKRLTHDLKDHVRRITRLERREGIAG